MKTKPLAIVSTLFVSLLIVAGSTPNGFSLVKPQQGRPVILNKMYTKFNKVEFGLANVDFLLNHSYIDTLYVGGSISYFFSDEWGIELNGGYAFLADKPTRYQLENWFDPHRAKNYDPAAKRYTPIYPDLVENQFQVAANIVFTPFYAKQLIFLTLQTYFDTFFTLGGGVNQLVYYPSFNWAKEDTTLSAEEWPTNEEGKVDIENAGYSAGKSERYGEAGRNYFYQTFAAPRKQMAPTFNIGFGQRYFFLQRFNLRFDLKDYVIVLKDWGGNLQVVNHIMIRLGLGVMF